MENIKKMLKERMDRLTRPEPTIRIFNGSEYYFTDTGEAGRRSDISVQLSVKFREKQLRQLKGPILGVFICIALHINEQGLAWPSCALIGKETGYARDTIFCCLRSLERMGYLSRVQLSNRETGKFASNVYQLFPKSRRFKDKSPRRVEPRRLSPDTAATDTKKNQK
jgi:hypothetical protein